MPWVGSAGSPVSTTSKNTVPCMITSKSGSAHPSKGATLTRVLPYAIGAGGRRRLPGAADLPGAAGPAGPGRSASWCCATSTPTGWPSISQVLRPDPADPGRGWRPRSPTAVAGADFVFSAIRVGGAAGRVADERRALAAGVLGQETVGAGGLAYGLRTLPVALELARTVAELAPRRLADQLHQPGRAGHRGQPDGAGRAGDRDLRLADRPGPAGLPGAAACPQAELQAGQVVADYAGINHLGWLRAAAAGRPGPAAGPAGRRRRARASFEEGRLFGAPLLRALGAVPNEYLYFYYRRAEVLAALAAGPTRGEVVLREQEEFYAAAAARPAEAAARWEATRRRREESYLAERDREQARDEHDLAGGGYEQVALDLMQALSGGPAGRLIVNVANGATLPQLPPDLVIEVPCRVDAGGAHPLPVAPLDLHQLGLIASVRASRAGRHRGGQHRLVPGRAAGVRAVHPLVGSPRIGAAGAGRPAARRAGAGPAAAADVDYGQLPSCYRLWLN